MKIKSLSASGSLADVGEIPDSSVGFAYSSILDGIVYSIPSKSAIYFMDLETGGSDLLVLDERFPPPKGLVFSGNGETLHVESDSTFWGIRTKSLVAFHMLGLRGEKQLASIRKRKTDFKRWNGMAYLNQDVYISYPESDCVVRIGGNSLVSKVLGGETRGFGIATSPLQQVFNQPCGIATMDSTDIVLICDTGNGVIRKFNAGLEMTGIVGAPSRKAMVDGREKEAQIECPTEIIDAFGNSAVFIDGNGTAIRRWDLLKEKVTTLYRGKDIRFLASNVDTVFFGEVHA